MAHKVGDISNVNTHRVIPIGKLHTMQSIIDVFAALEKEK